MTINVGVPGIGDPGRLIRWLEASGVPDAARLSGIELIAGGRSNLTYRLDFGSGDSAGGEYPHRLVLRRPPLGHVLPTAHDMSREYRVLSALSGGRVPVPAPVGFCADTAIIGAPFYVMAYVEGLALRTKEDGEKITSLQASQISECLAQTLAAIHLVDVAAVGLDGFGRPEGYLARQLKRWQRQWDLSATRELPEFTRLVKRLADRPPEEGEGTLVHGDFRLDNLLIGLEPEPRVAAVVDWEMSTLGDPLADLGLTLSYWTDPGDTQRLGIELSGAVTSRDGFLSSAGFTARYAELTGRDVSGIGYYTAFGCFKLAVVLESIHARFLQNKTVGEGFDQAGSGVPILVERANRMLDDLA
ncbi:MAG TPA: phosphotransferase family protein [Streptosporangiaceae bacterium]|nr:phosphotransferase family protein [Streptosporangiaceae bacterium]